MGSGGGKGDPCAGNTGHKTELSDMPTPPLPARFDQLKGDQRGRDEAMQAQLELDKTPLAEAYTLDIRDTIMRLASRQLAFTPDEVRAALHPLTREKLDEKWPNGDYRYANALSAEFQQMARAGLIAWTGNVVASTRSERRGGMQRQWRAA